MVRDLGLLAAGLAVYGAVFALVGALVRRPLAAGLVFVFGWELLVLALPGGFKRLTVAYYLQGLVPHAMPGGSTLSLLQSVFSEPLGVGESLGWMALFTGASLWLAARAVATREYVLEQ